MRIATILAVTIIMVCGCRQPNAQVAASCGEFEISLSNLKLNEAERISAVRMQIHGGRAVKVNIPDDWFVEAGPETGDSSVVTLEGNHGTSWLSHADGLDGCVTVAACNRETMKIAATIELSRRDSERTVALRDDQLVLIPIATDG